MSKWNIRITCFLYFKYTIIFYNANIIAFENSIGIFMVEIAFHDGLAFNNNLRFIHSNINIIMSFIFNIIFFGEKGNIPNILASSDLTVLTSAWGEGFPNVLGESLASGILCVSTDVGDSKLIINKYGFIVSPGSYEQISSAILKALSMSYEERLALGVMARNYIEKNYSIDKVYNEYLNIYRDS